jgi:hypothetical protein
VTPPEARDRLELNSDARRALEKAVNKMAQSICELVVGMQELGLHSTFAGAEAARRPIETPVNRRQAVATRQPVRDPSWPIFHPSSGRPSGLVLVATGQNVAFVLTSNEVTSLAANARAPITTENTPLARSLAAALEAPANPCLVRLPFSDRSDRRQRLKGDGNAQNRRQHAISGVYILE